MFIRQWIVCGVLGLGLLGTRPLFAQNKPADLPIDPRVQCEDGQESDPYRLQPDLPRFSPGLTRVSSRCADNCEDTFVQRLQRTWESWEKWLESEDSLPNLRISIALGFGADANAGPVVLVTMADVNGEVLDTAVPLPCSPLMRWTGCASAWIWQCMTGMILSAPTPPTPEQQETPPACPYVRPVEAQEEEEELDPIFLEMLRKTKPLGLVPTPQIEPNSKPAETVDSARAAEFARRVNLDRPSKELVLENFVNVETEPPSDAARRACPRIDEGVTILYVDAPPPRLTIEE